MKFDFGKAYFQGRCELQGKCIGEKIMVRLHTSDARPFIELFSIELLI